ncbi:hypothetical protein [Bradyrhizobium sp. BR 1432]|uniref:hypothetical protein n=1 Tax=Bradyrhizobium sp. BR 1432 TaxID=3447966 RepID=UPI003EE7D7B1
MHSPLSQQSFLLPQALFPMTHLLAVVEVAAFAVEEDFTAAGCALVASMAAACGPPTSGAVPFMPDASMVVAGTAWPEVLGLRIQ